MAVGNITNVHTLSHIVSTDFAGAGTNDVLSQLSNVRTTPGIDLLVSSPSGNVFPVFAASASQNPEVAFDTTQVKTILDNTGVTMVDLTTAGSVLYFEKSANMGVRTGAGTHTTLTMPKTALICNQITAGHRTQAVASCRLLNVYDGTTTPLTIATNASMSGTKVDAEHYVLGGISINGTFLVDGIQDVTIDFGQEFFGGPNGLGADGTNYTTFFGINTIKPVITVRTHNLGWSLATLDGLAQSAVIVYLRKLTVAGPDVDATASAIAFTGTTGYITLDDTAGGGQDAAIGTLRLTQTATLAVNTATAIVAA
jgi:hypothetical protein